MVVPICILNSCRGPCTYVVFSLSVLSLALSPIALTGLLGWILDLLCHLGCLGPPIEPAISTLLEYCGTAPWSVRAVSPAFAGVILVSCSSFPTEQPYCYSSLILGELNYYECIIH